MKLGIISDTHGHLAPEIHTIFHGVNAILHAGDLGSENVLFELQTIAPVTAVRGNMDRHGVVRSYHEFAVVTFDGFSFFLVHDLGTPSVVKQHLRLLIQQYTPHVVVFGHTHTPWNHYVENILYLNPGSATSGRSGTPESVGLVDTNNSRIQATIIPLRA